MASKAQSFMLSEEQVAVVETMMDKTGLSKALLFRRALGMLAEELDLDWPEDSKPGRRWKKDELNDES